MRRSLTIFVLACVLALRAWVPVGWMPSATGGAFVIEPCPSLEVAPLSHASHHHGSPHKAQHDGVCAFAPYHAGAAPAAPAPLVVAPLFAAVPLEDGHPAGHFPTGPPAPPPPATGPPALA